MNILEEFESDPSDDFDKDSSLMREWLFVGPLRYFEAQKAEEEEPAEDPKNSEVPEETYDDILQERSKRKNII